MNLYIAIAIVILLWLVVIAMMFKNKSNKKNKKAHKQSKRIIGLYTVLTKLPFIKNEVANVKKRLYDNYLYEEITLRYKATLYYLLSWSIAIGAFIFAAIYFKGNYFIVFALFFFCYYLKVIFLELFIGDDTKLLKGLTEFIDDLKQSFTLYSDVDLAFEEAINDSTNFLAVNHAKKILAAIQDEEALQDFMEDCSNQFLKLIALNSFLTKEYGDQKDKDNISVFNKSLKFINDLIKSELFKRRELKFWLKGMPLLALSTLLIFTPYENWVHAELPVTDIFYKSSNGLLIKIGITAITIMIFFILRKFSQTDIKKAKQKNYYWEDKILQIGFINKIVNFMKPKVGSRKHYKLKNIISRTQIYTKIEWIYLKKILTGVATFLFILILCIAMHKINYTNIQKNNTGTFAKDIVVINGSQIDSTSLEKNTLRSVKNVGKNKAKIQSYLKEKGIVDEQTLNDLTNKIVSKNKALKSEYLQWYEVVIDLLISILLAQIPILMLYVTERLRKFDMQNEVVVFETIILILMNYESSTVELILDYMAKFSNCFDQKLYVAINDLQKGNEEVLEKLIEEVNYKPFKNIIKCLIKAEDIEIKEAFSNLDSNRQEYTEDRKEENKKIIYKRASYGRGLALVPLILITAIYISIPFLMVSTNQMNTYTKQVINSNQN